MPHQSAVEQAHRQVRSLNVGGTLAEQGQDFVRLAENDTQFGAQQVSALIAVLDHLQILPARLRLFLRRRTALTRVGRDLTIDRDHGVINAAPAIRHGGRRRVRMPACLQRLEDFLRGFRFGLGDAACNAEPAVHVEHGRTPELAGRVGFGVMLFSPLFLT